MLDFILFPETAKTMTLTLRLKHTSGRQDAVVASSDETVLDFASRLRCDYLGGENAPYRLLFKRRLLEDLTPFALDSQAHLPAAITTVKLLMPTVRLRTFVAHLLVLSRGYLADGKGEF